MKKSISGCKIAVVGGDARMYYAAVHLAAEPDFEVALFGASSDLLPSDGNTQSLNLTRAAELSGALRGAEAVLLPLPYSDSGEVYIRTPLLELGRISVCPFFASLERGTIVFGGRFGEKARELCAARNALLIDYENDPVIVMRGAIATAEGVIALAMERTRATIFGSNCLVLGYGRCGKALADRLSYLGAHVSVAARSPQNLAEAVCDGCTAIDLSSEAALREALGRAETVINTIPSVVLTEARLRVLPQSSIIIDIASAPGGCDFDAAARLGISAALDLGLPGIVAPKSAGIVLAERIKAFIKNKGESK